MLFQIASISLRFFSIQFYIKGTIKDTHIISFYLSTQNQQNQSLCKIYLLRMPVWTSEATVIFYRCIQ